METKLSPAEIAARNELWRRGDLRFLYHAGQRKIDEVYRSSKGSLVVLNIARQWGKTYWGASKAIATCLDTPHSFVKYAAAFEGDLTEFVIPAFDAVLESCPPHLRPVYIAHKRKYIFKHNGSEIKLIGLDRKKNALRGNTKVRLIVLDEAGIIGDLPYLYSSVIIPLTTHARDAKVLLLSTPPESPSHPFWDFVDLAREAGSYAEFTIDQNPLLGPEDVTRIEKEMGGRHTTAFRREYLCQRIIEEEKAVIPEWRPDYEQEFDLSSDPKRDYWHRHVSMDMGVVDLTALLFATYKKENATLYIEDEMEMSGPSMTTTPLARAIKLAERTVWPDRRPPYRRTADNNNPLLLQTLSVEHDIHFTPVSKQKLHEMVDAVRLLVRLGRLIVHPRCKKLLGCLRSALWDKNRKEFDRHKLYGHYDHLAALVYLVRNLDTWTDPVPATFGLKPDQIILRRKPELPALAKALQGPTLPGAKNAKSQGPFDVLGGSAVRRDRKRIR